VVDCRSFDLARPGGGGQQQQGQTVRAAGHGETDPLVRAAQAIEISREARDKGIVGDHI
jgi:hypothetical protein